MREMEALFPLHIKKENKCNLGEWKKNHKDSRWACFCEHSIMRKNGDSKAHEIESGGGVR